LLPIRSGSTSRRTAMHVANSAIVTRTGDSSRQGGERTCRSILLVNRRLRAHPKPATEQCAHGAKRYCRLDTSCIPVARLPSPDRRLADEFRLHLLSVRNTTSKSRCASPNHGSC
jgi:hypothetical protein